MENLQAALIRLLEEDARYTVLELAAMTGASAEEVKAEVRRLESDGVIVKYSAIVNSERLNVNTVQALIEVRVTPKKLRGFDAVAEELNNYPEVKSLYLMSGGFDIAIFVEAKNACGRIAFRFRKAFHDRRRSQHGYAFYS